MFCVSTYYVYIYPMIKQQSQETTVNKQDGKVYTANAVIRATLTESQEELAAVHVLSMIFHHTSVSLCQIHSPFHHIHTRLFFKVFKWRGHLHPIHN